MKTRHHILWPRRKWGIGVREYLRSKYEFQIDDDAHRDIHAAIDEIPVPSDVIDIAQDAPPFDDPTAACYWLMCCSEDRNFTDAMRLQAELLQNRPPW